VSVSSDIFIPHCGLGKQINLGASTCQDKITCEAATWLALNPVGKCQIVYSSLDTEGARSQLSREQGRRCEFW